MKLLPFLFTAILGGMSFAALASQQIDQAEAAAHQQIGSISVSGVRGSTDDAVRALARKADEQNAPYYRVIEVANPGNSSAWLGNADIYR
ncbi:DUF1471 domain-containing protein [Sodalis sp. RH15]|uniref:DUF1471 domain-containing protein n=1 Tax=Sodalis sp. RH15 TaxID=3394330 RepID=UPI0039B658E2